ncbi:hypothetical protein KSD_86250 [Ktedonobacter sp. SOSP1-85]|uniref:outer membrane protein assembly factor BamB family protein n=1 Tax=Ktedonobacter sp. SOSP1-85 TaxID=2778367 RepID=UPI0019169E3D|nr:PQQ-binding-like beta-propeller repeat protein [Ktedonobacter sp. SOSP1-85]GHO80854.1 hypothetical protein KSD_86250 [Ktedonobacter sp. SOSP1-85]
MPGKRISLLSLLCCLALILAACATNGSQSSTDKTSTIHNPHPTTLPTSIPTPGNNTDWTMYHHDDARSGYLPNTPDPRSLSKAWSLKLDGAVYAEPLVIGNHVIVATENDTLYALDTKTGQIQWQRHVGTPAARSNLPCGNIDPLGITGTPVYDPATRLVFAVAEISQGPTHILVGVDVQSGQVKVRRNIDPPGIEVVSHQQRAALALANNTVYVALGGLAGDCGNYHGTVIGSRTDGQGKLLVYQVPTNREGGIWAPPGPVIDADQKLYVAVGNGESTGGDWDHTDSILRLSPELELEEGFAPQQWAQDNSTDADLGSMSPVLLSNGLIFSAGKSGQGYVVRAHALGGVGGQLNEQTVCRSFGGAATDGSQVFLPCVDGVQQITVNTDGSITPGWKAPSQINGSPIIAGHTVYTLAPQGTLYALNSANGSTRASLAIDATTRFATPTISGQQIFIGTTTGITSINLAA